MKPFFPNAGLLFQILVSMAVPAWMGSAPTAVCVWVALAAITARMILTSVPPCPARMAQNVQTTSILTLARVSQGSVGSTARTTMMTAHQGTY